MRKVCSDGNGDALTREGIKQEGNLWALMKVGHCLWIGGQRGGGAVSDKSNPTALEEARFCQMANSRSQRLTANLP